VKLVKYIVNSSIMRDEISAETCALGTPKMLKKEGFKDIHVEDCYCCGENKKVVVVFDAPNKDSLSKALTKIKFPVESIMEAKKMATD
jgi:hypothetical protein